MVCNFMSDGSDATIVSLFYFVIFLVFDWTIELDTSFFLIRSCNWYQSDLTSMYCSAPN